MSDHANSNWLLNIIDLTTRFGTGKEAVPAVEGINLQIYPQETIGIVGESGSGKSITALSVMNLLPKPNGHIASGQILFNSPKHGIVDLAKTSAKTLRSIRGREISMIFQEPMTSLNPVVSCGKQVMEVIQKTNTFYYKQAKSYTLALLAKVELPDPEHIFKSFPHQLSGGQKQRVMIAMAICCRPSLLIADEPTTALDVTVQAHILALITKLKTDHKMAVMFITHDLGVVAEIADKILVLYQGKIVEQGTVWDVFSNPQHPYTKGLLACRPRMDVKLHTLPTVADFTAANAGNGEHVSRYSSVGAALLDNFASDDEVLKHRANIYNKPSYLKVNRLKTYFKINKGLFSINSEYIKAVDDVSFEVFPGETLGLVGESGCGKTTLGRSLARLVEPMSGEVLLNGKNILQLPRGAMKEFRKEIQIIFQDPFSSLNPRIPIGEALIEPMRAHNFLGNDTARKKRILELLERIGMKAEHFYRYPHEFSGGQRQRISIARAVALSPKFIICDESVSALDVSVQAQVLNLLNELKKEFHFTCLFISHNLAVVKFMADRIMVMNAGKIVELEFAENIYSSPSSEYTKKLLAAIPKGDLEDIRKRQLQRGIRLAP